MSRRAVPAIVLLLASVAGLIIAGRDTEATPTPFFAVLGATWMPSVPDEGSLTASWFCPGVPASGEEGVGGGVVVSNRDDTPMVGRYSILTVDGVAVERDLTVEPWSQTRIDVDATLSEPTAFASVVVEIEGGGGLVEQIARHPDGTSVAPCSNDTSASWYLAEGSTADDTVETLVLTNPFDEIVSADLRFATEERESTPGAFQGFSVAPRSVRTIPIAELGARDEPVIAVAVEATAGRLVVGRVQEYDGGGRAGYDVSLATPELREQWWFADGERGEGITETYSIYNPTDDEVEVSVFFGGLPTGAGVADLDPIRVPPRRVVVFDPYADPTITGPLAAEDPDEDELVDFGDEPVGEIPEGRHATVFSTLAQPSIVVERVLTRTGDDGTSTTVVMGAPPRPDGYVASVWSLGIGPTRPSEDALVLYNIDQADALVTVQAVGPAGPSAVPSLTEIEVGPGEITTIDLTDPDVLGRELIVTSSSRVFVERSLPRGEGLSGRTGSFLLPADL